MTASVAVSRAREIADAALVAVGLALVLVGIDRVCIIVRALLH